MTMGQWTVMHNGNSASRNGVKMMQCGHFGWRQGCSSFHPNNKGRGGICDSGKINVNIYFKEFSLGVRSSVVHFTHIKFFFPGAYLFIHNFLLQLLWNLNHKSPNFMDRCGNKPSLLCFYNPLCITYPSGSVLCESFYYNFCLIKCHFHISIHCCAQFQIMPNRVIHKDLNLTKHSMAKVEQIVKHCH